MLILGLDPGTTHSGLALWDAAARRVVMAQKDALNTDVLRIIRATEAQQVVIEALSPRGQVVGWDTFRTIEWVGRMQQHCIDCAKAVAIIHRDDIKRLLLGRANVPGADKHIRQVLLDDLGEKGTKARPGPTFGCSSHAWSALAAVHCWIVQGHLPTAIAVAHWNGANTPVRR